MTHTKGEWKINVGGEGNHFKLIDARLPNVRKNVCTVYGETEEEVKANARLIAAAPKLLEALREIVTDFKPYGSYSNRQSFINANEAIKKATP